MRLFWQRLVARHANVLSFWAVVLLIALALVLVVALVQGRLG